MPDLTVGSLFSGIGGLDLGLERAGLTIRWQAEIDRHCVKVLQKHWPDVPNIGNVVLADWQNAEPVDVICGGYPCQPFSHAGKQKGKHDIRHLWPFAAEAIRALRPRYVLLENVIGHLRLGFGDVLSDLASIGYDCRWDCLPAYHFGAPHYRDRVFIIGVRREAVLHSGGYGFQKAQYVQTLARRLPKPERTDWWQSEPGLARLADGVPNKMVRVKALGNAVVPQVAEHLGKIILKLEESWISMNGTT